MIADLIRNYLPLILGIVGFVFVIYLRIPEKKISFQEKFSKFSFLLKNYLYIDNNYGEDLLKESKKFSSEELYLYLLQEIKKNTGKEDTYQKLVLLFKDLGLIEYAKILFHDTEQDQKSSLTDDFLVLPFKELIDLFIPELFKNNSIVEKLKIIKALSSYGYNLNSLPILTILSNIKSFSNLEITEFFYQLSQIFPVAKLKDAQKVDVSSLAFLENHFSDLMHLSSKESIAGSYMFGLISMQSKSAMLMRKLETSEDKELKITILRALKKINEEKNCLPVFHYLLSSSITDIEIIQESLVLLHHFGHQGDLLIQELSRSDQPIINVISKSFLEQL